jgi:Rrf2 family nitric oxide-sensitive transcriptional repressor
MQLTQFTDYALRALILIAIKDGPSTITEISDSYKISRHHLVKIIHKLSQLGYIHTTRGNKGGITLNKPANEINLAQLIQDTEPNFNLVECFDKEKGTCCIIPVCKLKTILQSAQIDFLKNISQYTLADIIQNKQQLAEHLKLK